jgi:hypothetical protein
MRAVCVRLRTDPVHALVEHYCRSVVQTFSGEIAMKGDWIEDGWRRFLDRLKGLWGKRTDSEPAMA